MMALLRRCKHGVAAPKGGCERCRVERKEREAARYQRQNESRKARGVPRGGQRTPAKLRREVLNRAGGQCAVVVDGERCPQTAWLEVHHRDGNRLNNDIANLVPVCRAHHWMLEKKRRRK